MHCFSFLILIFLVFLSFSTVHFALPVQVVVVIGLHFSQELMAKVVVALYRSMNGVAYHYDYWVEYCVVSEHSFHTMNTFFWVHFSWCWWLIVLSRKEKKRSQQQLTFPLTDRQYLDSGDWSVCLCVHSIACSLTAAFDGVSVYLALPFSFFFLHLLPFSLPLLSDHSLSLSLNHYSAASKV